LVGLNNRRNDLNHLRAQLVGKQDYVEIAVETEYNRNKDYLLKRFFTIFLKEDTKVPFFKILEDSDLELQKEIEIVLAEIQRLVETERSV
jgi:hypothetical protein